MIEGYQLTKRFPDSVKGRHFNSDEVKKFIAVGSWPLFDDLLSKAKKRNLACASCTKYPKKDESEKCDRCFQMVHLKCKGRVALRKNIDPSLFYCEDCIRAISEGKYVLGAFPLSKYRENRLVKTKKIDRITLPIP